MSDKPSSGVTNPGATCFDCLNLTLDGGAEPYSDQTPGNPMEWRCTKGMYEFEREDLSRTRVRARSLLAEICPKFEGDGVRTPDLGCTAAVATWCPVHGTCACKGTVSGPGDVTLEKMDDLDCPLHGVNVGHPQ